MKRKRKRKTCQWVEGFQSDAEMEMSDDMFPRFSANHTPDRASFYSVSGSNTSLSFPTNQANSGCVGFRQLGMSIFRPSCQPFWIGSGEVIIASRHPAFSVPIGHVVGICSNPKMRRINTTGIIPIRAVVERVKSVRNWAVANNPRDSMRRHVSLRTAVAKHAVAIPVSVSHPQPATVWRTGFVHFLEKSLLESFAALQAFVDPSWCLVETLFRFIHNHVMFGFRSAGSATTGPRYVLYDNHSITATQIR